MFSYVIKVAVRVAGEGIKNTFPLQVTVFVNKTILLKSILFCLIALLTLHLTACSSTYAPVEQRSATAYKNKPKYTGKTPLYYSVKKGDTLYSIAWLYGLDFKSIAHKNKIKSPYRIYSGQKLRLRAFSSKKTQRGKKSQKKTKVVSSKSKYRKKSVKKKTPTTTYTKKNKKTSTAANKKLKWAWPVKGRVIQRYSPAKGKKGIDISASKGALVKSSEAGKVVYSGQGLVGYGRLIIIKHNDNYLSAYAHNQTLLVNEGQFVKKGQSIARLGRSGTDRYKLHFEIRKKGKPVNPLSYLPR